MSGVSCTHVAQTEDVAMRTLCLDAFWRAGIGFYRLFDLVGESVRYEPEDHYPPCKITRTGENTHRVAFAVGGFRPDQINVSVNQTMLIVVVAAGQSQEKGEY